MSRKFAARLYEMRYIIANARSHGPSSLLRLVVAIAIITRTYYLSSESNLNMLYAARLRHFVQVLSIHNAIGLMPPLMLPHAGV